jgi:protein SCO1/2
MKQNKILSKALPLIIVLTSIILYFLKYIPTEQSTIQLNKPLGGDFIIPSTVGKFDTKQLRGHIILFFFGFTNCPYVCPTTLKSIHTAIELLDEPMKSKVITLFISIDNERDTIDSLKKKFDPTKSSVIASTDSTENLIRIANLYGAYFTKTKDKESSETYFDHTSDIFIINPKGEWVKTLNYQASPQEIAEVLMQAKTKAASAESSSIKRNRTVPIIGEVLNCDIGKTHCSFTSKETGKVEINLTPAPVLTQQNLRAQVIVDDHHDNNYIKPIEIDFEGINLNMGLIRPALKEVKPRTFEGIFFLPICETPKMLWRARLIYENHQKKQEAIVFYFETLE